MSTTYTPGAVATVADLEPNDLIFMQERKGFGLPTPTHPARVTAVEPSPNGSILVSVVPANAGESVEPRLIHMQPTREFRRAVAVPAE